MLHTNKIEGFLGWLKRWIPMSGPYNLSQNINIYLWLRTIGINKGDPFLALVNLVRENNSTDVMHVWKICPFCHTDFIQEQTHNLRCWSWAALTASKPLKQMPKFKRTLKFTLWGRFETSIICLNNFNKQEELICLINASPWTDIELPVHNHICHYCKLTLETNDKIEEHIFIKYYRKYTLWNM